MNYCTEHIERGAETKGIALPYREKGTGYAMILRIFQKGFNYSQDGPGNRLVYHLQGCNMHCPWCANPEGMTFEPPRMVTGKLYDEACPFGAIKGGQLDRRICVGCEGRGCEASRRCGGIEFQMKEVPVEEILREAKACHPMFFDGGGVTFTGGEPTMQYASLHWLLSRLQQEGIHTAMETNGSHPLFENLLPSIDYLMMDYKHPDDEEHKRVTGVGSAMTARNIRLAVERGREPHVRIPFIHGFNDTPEAIDGFRAFFSSLDGPFTVEVLRYHEYGKDKWEQCGLPYLMHDAFVDDEAVRTLEAVLRDASVQVVHT